MSEIIKETLELVAPISSKELSRLIRKNLISKLVINYEFDTNPANCDYLSDVDENGLLHDCAELPFKPFVSPFENIKLTKINFPIEIGPKCTSLRGLFAGQKNLKSVLDIRETSHVTCFNYMFSDCFHLLNVPKLNLESAISVVGLYSGCHRLKSFSFQFQGGNRIINASGMFKHCYYLKNAPELYFPNCKIASSLFDGCIRLTQVPFYSFDELRDASLMFGDCIQLEYCPDISMPKASNLIRMFSNCRRLIHINPYLLSLILSKSQILLLAAFDGCCSLDEKDAQFLIDHRADALLSYHETVLEVKDGKKIIDFNKRRLSFINRHWISNIIIFSMLLFAIALFSMRFWKTESTKLEVGKSIANSKAKLLTMDEATHKAQYRDSNELLSMYSFRCDDRITYESYLKLLINTVKELGRYKMALYRVNDGKEQFILALTNQNSSYLSDVIDLSDTSKRVILMKKQDNLDSSMNAVANYKSVSIANYIDIFSKQQIVVNATDFFVLEQKEFFILLHHKYQNIPVDFSDNLFFQYSDSVLLKEVDTGRYLVPMPKLGYFYYLDDSGQVSEEKFGKCFEINEYTYEGLNSGLTYIQAKREAAKKIDSEFKRRQGDELETD